MSEIAEQGEDAEVTRLAAHRDRERQRARGGERLPGRHRTFKTPFHSLTVLTPATHVSRSTLHNNKLLAHS